MIPYRFKQLAETSVIILLSAIMFGCAEKVEDKVEATFSSLWDYVFDGCGIVCHSIIASDFTDLGPILTEKTGFYNNLVNKKGMDHTDWSARKTGNCNHVNFITPGDIYQSTMAASLIETISTKLATAESCLTSYGLHSTLNATITDPEIETALIDWINNGAQDN